MNGLHALLVSRGGALVFEHYEQGVDEALGRPLGMVAFSPDVRHDLRSVSKSVVGLLYGIALADGKVPPSQARLYDQCPEYADLATLPGRDRLAIHDVLDMTLGLEWDELSIPYGKPGNSEMAMEAAPDRFRFILERPIVGEPGRTHQNTPQLADLRPDTDAGLFRTHGSSFFYSVGGYGFSER